MICIYDGATWVQVDTPALVEMAEKMTDLERRMAALEEER